MFKKKTKVKAVKKVISSVEEPPKDNTPIVNPQVEHFRKLRDETGDPLKKAEYQFWMETHQGKNPEVPPHMRGGR